MTIYLQREDSFLLQKAVKKSAKSKRVLDMGAGSGIQAQTALKAGAKNVLAIDIDPEVIAHLKKQNLKAIKSNLFQNVNGKFDLIVFNPPYLPEDRREDKESARVTSGGKKGDEILMRFLKQAPAHLEKNGIILLVVSSLTPQNRIINLIKCLNISRKIIGGEKFFMESLEVWEIKIAEEH